MMIQLTSDKHLMASGLGKFLNIEKEEVSSVSILLFQSVFLGIFAGAFDVSAQSYFLEVFSADLIPRAFAYSGAVGIVITSLYSYLQSRMRFSLFSVINLLFVAVVATLLRIGFYFFDSDLLVFAMFVLMGPLTIVAFLGFWGTVSRMFSLRQGKRLFGLIDTGQIMGIIIASYAIPVLLSFQFKILNSLYICSGSVIVALIIQIYISSGKSLEKVEVRPERKRKSSFLDLFKSRYTFLMVGFVVLSVLGAFFIHYSFLVVTEVNYPDPKSLASFLGVFMGTVMVFTLIIKTFVYARLMKTYGLKLALVISPILLGIFVIGALIVGSVYGYTASSAGFTMFFLLTVSGKLFSKSFKDSVEVPSSKILYQSLDPDVRYDVQSRVDGTVNELAAFSSGLLMAGLAMISGIKLIHFLLVLGLILIIWTILAFRLHKSYRVSLRESLNRFQNIFLVTGRKDKINEIDDIKEYSSNEVGRLIEFAPQSWNGFLSRNLPQIMDKSTSNRENALYWIDILNLTESYSLLKNLEEESGENQKGIVQSLLSRFNLKDSDKNQPEIEKLGTSRDPEKRLKAIVAIGNQKDDYARHLLAGLLRDKDFKVRVSAIRLVGKQKIHSFTGHLIDLLDDEVYYPFAFAALHEMAEEIADRLDHAFYRSSASPDLKRRLLNLMCGIRSEKIIPFLMAKLEQPELFIHKMVLKRLGELKYQPGEAEMQRLSEYLQRMIGIASWNIATRQGLNDGDFNPLLLECFDQEIRNVYDHIFTVLSVMYDPQTIYQIKKNIETGMSETIDYSLELLDLFLDENLKSGLFALLEDSQYNQKITRLQTEYPVEILHGERLLHSILNRDYNYIDPYTRTLAILDLSGIEAYRPGNDLIAHLFNPDLRMAEVAAAQYMAFDETGFREASARLDAERRTQILNYVEKTRDAREEFLHISRIDLLKESGKFEEFSLFDLYVFAEKFRLLELKREESKLFTEISEEGFFIYTASPGLLMIDESGSEKILEPGQFFYSGKLLSDYEKDNVKLSSSVHHLNIMILPAENLKTLIFDNEESYLPFLNILTENLDYN